MPTNKAKDKAEKAAFKLMKQAYKKKWGAPLGKRKCKYSTAKDCLGVADEDQFNGHKCLACVRQMHRELYAQRVLSQGKKLVGRGRPLGAKDLKPRKNARPVESDSE